MDPVQIKNALKDAGISQSDIARACRVTPGHVHRVILGMSISHPVQAVIAAAIERPVEEVFPNVIARSAAWPVSGSWPVWPRTLARPGRRKNNTLAHGTETFLTGGMMYLEPLNSEVMSLLKKIQDECSRPRS